MSETLGQSSEVDLVEARVAAMDAMLASGKTLMAKVDQFYEEHGLAAGMGEQMLTGIEVPEEHRHLFRRLFAEFRMIEQRLDELDPTSARPSPVAVGARAIGNRFRI